jgi:hypothetical protein
MKKEIDSESGNNRNKRQNDEHCGDEYEVDLL